MAESKPRTAQFVDEGWSSARGMQWLILEHFQRSHEMLWTLSVILIVMWLLGMVSSYTMSGYIHILLVAAIILVLVRLIQGRRIA